MSGPRGIIRNSSLSSTTYFTGPTGTRPQVIGYGDILDNLNKGNELSPDERKFVVDNEARFAEDMECNGSCKDAVAFIHKKGSGRTRHARRRKTRGGGGLQQLFTRRKISPPRPHTSYVGYANGPPRALEGRHKPIPKEWMEKHRKSMANPKKGGRRSTRRGARASRKRPTQ